MPGALLFILIRSLEHCRDGCSCLLICRLCDGVRIDREGHAETYGYEYEKAQGELEELTHRLLVHIPYSISDFRYTRGMTLRTGLISVLIALLLPLFAFADTGRAGFPASSIWLSNTMPLSGQSITVYAVVYNSTANKLDSTLTFNVDEKTLSTMAVSLASGASQIYSTQWVAAEGTHTFSGTLSGTTVSDVAKDTGTVSITVAAPPAPSPTQQAVAQTTNIVNSIASSSIPVVSKVSQVIYNTTEDLREKGLAYMQAQSGASTTSVAVDRGAVLGTSTVRSAAPKSGGIMAAIWSVLLMIFASRAIFYPVFLILILFILWLLMKWVNKPRF